MPTVAATRQVGVKLPLETVNALAAEAHRLTLERGRNVSVAAVIRAAVAGHLARTTRVQQVANPAPTSVGSA
jgi:hypothetical protein